MPLFRLGAISHERFLKLSAKYEVEQKELTEKAKVDQAMVRYLRADFDSFQWPFGNVWILPSLWLSRCN